MPAKRIWLNSLFATVITTAVCLCSAAEACGLLIRITYTEDTPDWFHVEFLEGDGYELTRIELDLRPALGKPFIDTAYPNSRHSGKEGITLTESSGLAEGSSAMEFAFAHFTHGKKYTLLIDLDGRHDMLHRNELHGAKARVTFVDNKGSAIKLEGTFDSDAVAELGNRACA